MNFKKKINLLLILSLVVMSTSCQEKKSEAQMVDLLIETVNTKKFSKIKRYLADDYQYESYQGAMAVNVLQQVVSQYPFISKYEIIETISGTNNTQIDFTITTENGTEKKSLILNHDLKVLRSDLANISVQGHNESEDESSTNSAISEAVKHMPFKLGETGQMIVKASVNGREGNFVIDTGTATHLMLNSSYYKVECEAVEGTPLGVSGKMNDVTMARIDDFVWEGVEFSRLDAIVADTEHLGQRMNIEDFGGTIGFDLLKEFALDFDYSNEILSLWTDTEEMRKQHRIAETQVLPMRMVRHVPVITLNIGEEEVRLGIDSGAEGNMLEPEWEEKLEGLYVNKRQEEYGGADNNYVYASKATIKEVNVNGQVLELDFLFAGLFGGNHKVELLDGLIGLQFLKAQRTILNLKDEELYLLN